MKPTLPPTLCALCFAASSALAQAQQLEEVIVTAEFRPVNIQNQAASVSVLGADDIAQRAAQHLEDVLNIAPNVNFSSGSSRARFYQIRGIGERSQFQEPLTPSIGFVIDGVDFSGLGTAGTLFDVDQVEILRGPQGTLHGANALAGLINIRTGQPQAEPALKIEAGLADYFYHGTSHYLGIDAHDAGSYDEPLAEGVVITIEPGVYIAKEEIGIRIEDDVLITKTGARLLSKAPRARKEIEKALSAPRKKIVV